VPVGVVGVEATVVVVVVDVVVVVVAVEEVAVVALVGDHDLQATGLVEDPGVVLVVPVGLGRVLAGVVPPVGPGVDAVLGIALGIVVAGRVAGVDGRQGGGQRGR
jgi:hypothetical protein